MAKRSLVAKPYAGGQWSEARARSFVMSALRRGHWPAKYAVLNDACIGKRTNKSSGRQAKHYTCNSCMIAYPAKEVSVDHIDPVIPIVGYPDAKDTVFGYDWNAVIRAMLCEPPALQVLCKTCHDSKTALERSLRDEHKQRLKQQSSTIQTEMF